MSRTSPDSGERETICVPPRLWETLPPVHRRALVALLTGCLLKQMSALTSRPAHQEVQHEPPPCRQGAS
jgi:hypothetical protein